MDPGSIVYVLALLIGAVVVVLLLLRIMKARAGTEAKALPPTVTPSAPQPQEELLDSSHILPGGADSIPRAADPTRRGQRK